MIVVVPVTEISPESVTAPVEVTARFPAAVVAPRLMALAAAMVMFPPVRTRAPVKTLVVTPRVMFAAVASMVVVPVMASFPVLVTAPPGSTTKLPVRVEAPRTVAMELVIVAVEPVTPIAPVKAEPA